MRGLLLAVLARASCPEPVPLEAGAPGAHVQHRLSGEGGAVCLDGGAPAYYLRPGSGDGASKWYIHHQGHAEAQATRTDSRVVV